MIGKTMILKRNNVRTNAILNTIKTIMGIMFPLITFPYAARILQVHALGEYNFSTSIISYFIMLAGLGISSYAIREGTQYRENREKFSKFASEVFSINLYATVFSYILLIFCLCIFRKLDAYRNIIILLSVGIFFTTIGVNWILNIFEDFLFITFQSILFQILSIFALFIFVRSSSDLYAYSIIYLFSSVGSNIVSFFYAKKYVDLKFVSHPNISKHLKPILILCGSSIAILIYVSSDTTLLGIMVGDYSVGIYSVSVKVYSIFKQVLSAILIVTIPRFALYATQNMKNEYLKLFKKVFDIIVLTVLPVTVGLIMLAKEVISIIAGESYLEATSSLQLLTVSLIFYLFAYLYGQCVLVPFRREKDVLIATIVSAIINITLNVILIPFFKQDASAFTTILGEGIVMVICWRCSKKYIGSIGIEKNTVLSIAGSIGIVFVCLVCRMIFAEGVIFTISAIIFSIILYIGVHIVFKNEIVVDNIRKIIKYLIKKKGK